MTYQSAKSVTVEHRWDAVTANIRWATVVNVIGTSTCIIGVSEQQALVPGVCGPRICSARLYRVSKPVSPQSAMSLTTSLAEPDPPSPRSRGPRKLPCRTDRAAAHDLG
jgi:hypothetical protein